MTTSLLSKADAEFATLRRRRQELAEEEDRLHSKLRDLQAEGRRESEDQQREVAKKLNEVLEERRSMQGAYTIAKGKAREVAAQQIRESGSYRKQVLAAASAWARFLVSSAALVATTDAARREGVPLVPIPPGVAPQSAVAASWVKRHIADGVLDPDALPKELQELLEEGR